MARDPPGRVAVAYDLEKSILDARR